MAIIEGDEISQLWGLITELSEQLNQNRSASVSLYAQAGSVKVGYNLNSCFTAYISIRVKPYILKLVLSCANSIQIYLGTSMNLNLSV